MSNGVVSIPLDSDSQQHESVILPIRNANFPLGEYVFDPEQPIVQAALDAFVNNDFHCNPIVLFGPSAVGKTALAEHLFSHGKQTFDQVCVTAATDFCRDYAEAVDTNAIGDFRSRYRNAELFFVDGLHQMVDKDAAQRELLSLIDDMLMEDRWVIVAMDQIPTEHHSLLPELASRLSMGLTVPLVHPSYAAKEALLKRLTGVYNITLNPDSIRLIAEQTSTVVQLNSVVARLAMTQTSPNPTIAVNAVTHALDEQLSLGDVDLPQIAAVVAKPFYLKKSDLRSPSRRRTVVRARGVAMFLSRRLTSNSLEEIGAYYGGRDHTTVLHACRRTASIVECEPALRRSLDEMTESLVC